MQIIVILIIILLLLLLVVVVVVIIIIIMNGGTGTLVMCLVCHDLSRQTCQSHAVQCSGATRWPSQYRREVITIIITPTCVCVYIYIYIYILICLSLSLSIYIYIYTCLRVTAMIRIIRHFSTEAGQLVRLRRLRECYSN